MNPLIVNFTPNFPEVHITSSFIACYDTGAEKRECENYTIKILQLEKFNAGGDNINVMSRKLI